MYSAETAQMCEIDAALRRPDSLNLQPRSALSGIHAALVFFWFVCVCTFFCVFCSNRTKDLFVQQARGFNISSPDNVRSFSFHVCCPHVCVFSLIVYQRILQSELGVFASLWSAALAPGPR